MEVETEMRTYQTWSVEKPMEYTSAETGFEARKAFAAKHSLPVAECMARWNRCGPEQHDFKQDPKFDLVEVCTKCGEERA
jgi:hypothetical protein